MLTIFITKYAKYLEEKVSVVRTLNYQFEKERNAVNDLSDEEFLKVLPKLQSQLNALCNCKLRVRVTNYPLITSAYRTLLKDSFILFSMLSNSLQNIDERFESCPKKDAVKCLSIYKLYIKEAHALTNMYNGAHAMFPDLPEIKIVDVKNLEQIEQYLSSLSIEGNENYEDSENGEILNTTVGNDELLGTISNFGNQNFDDSNSGEESSSGEPAEPDDFLSLILGMGKNPQTNIQISPSGSPNGRKNPFSANIGTPFQTTTPYNPFAVQPQVITKPSNPFDIPQSGTSNPFAVNTNPAPQTNNPFAVQSSLQLFVTDEPMMVQTPKCGSFENPSNPFAVQSSGGNADTDLFGKSSKPTSVTKSEPNFFGTNQNSSSNNIFSVGVSTVPANDPFGISGNGTTNSSSLFGFTSNDSSSSPFGSPSVNTHSSSNLFGTSNGQTNNFFGVSSNQQSSNPFGAPSNQSNVFGSHQELKVNPFL